MDEKKIFGKGISFPPHIGPDGRVAWSVGAQNIREAIRIILLTELRERLKLPEFGCGLKMFLFMPNNVSTHSLIKDRIALALERWEPRISVESVIVEKDPTDEGAAVITIDYKMVATQASEQMNMTFRLTDQQ
jgi:phage baseplate assembly protein W